MASGSLQEAVAGALDRPPLPAASECSKLKRDGRSSPATLGAGALAAVRYRATLPWLSCLTCF